MTKLTTVQLNAPYLILIGDNADPTYAKTGQGIVDWRPDLVAGQLRFGEGQLDLGVPDMTVAEAVEAGATVLLAASVFHFHMIDIPELKNYLRDSGLNVK